VPESPGFRRQIRLDFSVKMMAGDRLPVPHVHPWRCRICPTGCPRGTKTAPPMPILGKISMMRRPIFGRFTIGDDRLGKISTCLR